MKIKILALIFLCLCAFSLNVSANDKAVEIYKKCSPATVIIHSLNHRLQAIGQGSGFIARKDGVIVTNYHVVRRAHNIKVTIIDENQEESKKYDVSSVLGVNPEEDWVILKIMADDLPSLKIADTSQLIPGMDVYVLGSPAGYRNSITKGLLNGIRRTGKSPMPKKGILQNYQLQIDANISPGNSGGPVVNHKGEAIGIVRASTETEDPLDDYQNINWVVPAESFEKFMEIVDWEGVSIKKALVERYYKLGKAFYNIGKAYNDLGMKNEAIDYFDSSISIIPSYGDAHLALGYLYENEGFKIEADNAFYKAMWEYEAAINNNPDSTEAYFNLAKAYHKLGKKVEEEKTYLDLIKIEPENAHAHSNLGSFYLWEGNEEKAMEQLEILKKLNSFWAEEFQSEIAMYNLHQEREKTILEEFKKLKKDSKK